MRPASPFSLWIRTATPGDRYILLCGKRTAQNVAATVKSTAARKGVTLTTRSCILVGLDGATAEKAIEVTKKQPAAATDGPLTLRYQDHSTLNEDNRS